MGIFKNLNLKKWIKNMTRINVTIGQPIKAGSNILMEFIRCRKQRKLKELGGSGTRRTRLPTLM